jgi:HPt (histidine-containing phosphotransfer) domain-containing protein
MDYKHINLEYIEMVSGGDREIISELIGIFRIQSKEFHEEMLSLFGSGSYLQLGQLAHKAKSSVAIMGMEELASRMKQMETSAREGDKPDEYREIIEFFRSETVLALKELDDYLGRI